jgi:hypothetical protein
MVREVRCLIITWRKVAMRLFMCERLILAAVVFYALSGCATSPETGPQSKDPVGQQSEVPLQASNISVQNAVEKPRFTIGDRWVSRGLVQWQDGVEVNDENSVESKISAVSGDNIELVRTTLSSKSGTDVGTPSRQKLDASTWTTVNPNIVEGKEVILAFPLQVGKTWRYQYTVRDPRLDIGMTAKVEGWEEVRVPAGNFKALKVVHEGSWSFTNPYGEKWSGRIILTVWYAPEAKNIIRAEYHTRTSMGENRNKWTRELVQLEVP